MLRVPVLCDNEAAGQPNDDEWNRKHQTGPEMDELQSITETPPVHSSSPKTGSVADRYPVLAHFGCAPIGVIFFVPQNRLITAEPARTRRQMVTTFRQFRAN